MASVNPQYTLVGIAADLDWRPVRFTEPLPQEWLCSVCGIFPERRNALPCGHVACLTCFGRCAEAGRYACPVDGKSFSADDVKGKDYPEEELRRKKVSHSGPNVSIFVLP
ncbi:hypothetical protein HPB50_001287 [Hyalomma asiaticum]|uniref:Uncharacterized protein n=1 Tax=Hyalomma asiaticum TaxID=266040 RepID=A0ACB7RP61_HYAAI|nr:hypothetical protein HPB50_001287 [Hyalomma asiaticum]